MKDPKPKIEHDIYTGVSYKLGKRIPLEKPRINSKKDFLDVLYSRRSDSHFTKSLSLKELSHLLYLSNRINSYGFDQNNFLISQRTAPSAGGRHPVDLLVSKKYGGIRNFSIYNPVDHSMSELLLSRDGLDSFYNKINENLPLKNACVIWFSIQVDKTGSKYENPESLYWRDTGALLYCLQLVSEFMGLKSCPLGTLATEEFGNLFDDKKLVSGGGIILGK